MTRGGQAVAIVDTVTDWRKSEGISQKQVADQLHINQSYLSRMEKGERKWPDHLDPALSKISWPATLALIEERTGGWVKNRFGDVDPTPTALQLQIAKEMNELQEALGELILSRNVDWSKRIDDLENLKKENDDVNEISLVFKGVISEMIKQAKEGARK